VSFRKYLNWLESADKLVKVEKGISRRYEIAAVLKELDPQTALFEDVEESSFRVAGNFLSTKRAFAEYLGVSLRELIPTLVNAIEHPSPYEVVEQAPCQEVVITEPDLDALPILRHFETDGGNYITAGVVITSHPKWGQNTDFHRCMQFSKTELAMRVVRGRHFETFLRDQGKLDIAMCIGNSPNVLVAAATSIDIGVDELKIANTLQPLKVVRARTVDVFVPAESEFVLEGTVYYDRRHVEGPFVDLTETLDIVREEPVFVVKAITHRSDAVWHALLPGGLEHKVLMGMPREPTICRKVNEVVRCLDVNVNPGGCSWLHAIVQIDKQTEDDAFKAIRAAFAGHRSLKHVFIVDDDIDIYDPLSVEWAMATRFQGDRDMLILDKEVGSSLDPSAEKGTNLTTKIGFDLTKPLGAKRINYEKVLTPKVNVEKFLNMKKTRLDQ